MFFLILYNTIFFPNSEANRYKAFVLQQLLRNKEWAGKYLFLWFLFTVENIHSDCYFSL